MTDICVAQPRIISEFDCMKSVVIQVDFAQNGHDVVLELADAVVREIELLDECKLHAVKLLQLILSEPQLLQLLQAHAFEILDLVALER